MSLKRKRNDGYIGGVIHEVELNNLTEEEIKQVQNIDTKTISNTQWGYVGDLDQALTSTSTPSFNSVNVPAFTIPTIKFGGTTTGFGSGGTNIAAVYANNTAIQYWSTETGQNVIVMPDNKAEGFKMVTGGGSYMTCDTTTGANAVKFSKKIILENGDGTSGYEFNATAGQTGIFNRVSTGSIQCRTQGVNNWYTTTTHVFFDNHLAALTTNTYDCGIPAYYWKDVRGFNAYTQVSDESYKQDIKILDQKECMHIVTNVNPKEFRWKKSVKKKGERARVHKGFIAQDFATYFDGNLDKFAAVLKEEEIDDTGVKVGEHYAMRPAELIPILWACIQRLNTRLSAIEAQLSI